MVSGKQLRMLRQSSGQTQAELAIKLGDGGYTQSIVAAVENSKRNIGVNLLVDWADACDYDVSIEFNKR